MVRRRGWLLGAWCGWFAALHVAWAFGWRWGVPAHLSPITERPFFLAYDIAAGAVVTLLGLVGLAAPRRPQILQMRWTRKLLWIAAVGASIRALLGVSGDVSILNDGYSPTTVTLVADLWFAVVAALVVALLQASRRAAVSPGVVD